jgi:hypothetical protein
LLFLLVTLPAWYLPARLIRPHWLEFERRRVEAAQGKPIKPASEIGWLRLGLFGFGGLLWALMSLGTAAAAVAGRDWHLLWRIAVVLPLCALGGLAFGIAMKLVMNRRPRPAAE